MLKRLYIIFLWILVAGVPFSAFPQSTLSLSGNTDVCSGSSTTLSVLSSSGTSCAVSINMSTTTTVVTCGSPICFYDAGGPNGNYANSTAYTQTFISSNGSPISIHFSSIYVESSWDEVYLYDGTSTSGTLLNSGNTYNGLAGMTYTANSGSLTVYFTPDGSNAYDGWSAEISCVGAACDNYTYHWSNGQTGQSITVSPSQTTTYTVTATGSGCPSATGSITVNVYDCSAAPNSADIVGQDMVCEGSSATLSVNVDATPSICMSSVNMANTTTVVPCGMGICFYDSGGPNGDYANSTYYTHTFTSPDGSPLTIHFNTVNVEGCDEIYIYDGTSTSGTLLNSGNLYTGLSGMTYTGNSGSITVYFTPDGSVVYSGWSAMVYCTSAADFNYAWSNGSTATSITVTPSQTTTYTVTVSNDNGTSVTATHTVQVLDCSAAPNSADIVGQDMICEGSSATLSVNVDATPSICMSSVNMANTTTVVPCGMGVCFYDPGGPNGNYANSTPYTHTFTSSNGSPLIIHFNSMSVENSYDEVYVYDGTSTSGTLLNSGNTYNGLENMTYTGASGSITVYFTPDGSNVSSGWEAMVYCTDASNFNYSWSNGSYTPTISVSPSQTTTYTVTVSNDNGSFVTASHTVQVLDCSVAPSSVTISGASIICSGSTVTLNSLVDATPTTCMMNVTMTNDAVTQVPCGMGVCFYDPGGPSANYSNSTNCTHTFTSPDGSPLTIHFNSMSVETSYDYVYVYDGTTTSGTLLNFGNQYNGLENMSYTSNSGSLTIYFHSDGSSTYAGWEAMIYCTSAADFNYFWSSGETTESIEVSPTQTTTYTVTVSNDNGTSVTANFTVQVVSCDLSPSNITIEGVTTICEGSSTTLTASSEPDMSNCIQSVNMSNTTTTIVCGPVTCFYDSGGPNGTYANSTTYTHTFCSPDGNPISIFFNSVNVETCDEIYIYEGTSTAGTLLNSGNLYNGLAGMTYTGNSGCLTVYFTPDGSVVYDGWSAMVYCEGGSNFDYAWSNGQTGQSITVSPHQTTTYTVTVTGENGTTATNSITVDVADCGDVDGCPSIAPAELGTGLTEIVVDCSTTTVTLEANAVATPIETNNYTVVSIPYNPPYNYTDGQLIFTNATDDIWGSVLTLPFAFCYYGNTYNQIVPGANSVATFNTSVANGGCAWSYSASLPSSSLFSNTIFACYRDIYPNYYSGDGIYQGILGQYPCRSYVLSFNNIALYSCTSTRTFSSMIVLYEGTNIIDIYLRDAPTCTSWNSGNGVIGIQNSNCSAAVVPPGRNTGPWTAHNEAWRFIPTGTPNYTVTWYEGNGINGPVVGTGDVITVTPPGSTDYTARLQYTACNGDVFDITNTCHVTMNNNMEPITVTAEPDFLCANAPTTITANAPNAVGYEWNTGATTSSFVARPIDDPTTYTVTVTYSNGCRGTGSVTVNLDTETPTYIGNIGPLDAENNNCVFTVPDFVEQIRLDASDNYTATPELIITQSPAAGTTITSNTTVTVTIADECGNDTSFTVEIEVPNPMQIAVGPTRDILCYGASTGMASVSVVQGNAPYTYAWSADNGYATGVLTDSIANALPAGTYTVTVTDAQNCQQNVSITLNHLSQEMVMGTLAQNQDICRGTAPSALSITGCSGGDQSYYVWQQSADNVNFTDIAGSNNTTYASGVLNENTCYRIAYISDSCGTLYSNSVCVTLHDAISSDLFDTICQNTAYNQNGFNLTAAQTQTPGDRLDSLNLMTQYNCDSTVYLHLTILSNQTGTDERTIVENELPYLWNGVTFQSGGTQTATLTAANGCDSVVTMILHVNPNVTVEIDTSVCANDFPVSWQGHTFQQPGTQQVVFQAANGADSIVLMTVAEIPAQFVTIRDEICQNEAYSGNGFTVSADSTALPGIVELSHLLVSAQGCDSTVTLLLQVNPIYDHEFDVVACDSFIWNGHVYPESGRYTQQFESAHGCDSVVTKNVEVIDTYLEVNTLTEDFCENLTAILEVTTGLQSIQWSTGETTPQIEVHHAGTYIVTAHTAQCSAYDRIAIYPCPFQMYLPNAITPSASPGDNDYFFIPDDIADQLETCEFFIFDRWGKIVFQSTDPHFRWDGTSRGKVLSNYVFTYTLKVSVFGGGNYQYSGTITVL